LNPVLGVVAGYPVYVFPLLLNAGIVVGLAQALYLARRRGLDPAGYLDVAIWVVPGALIGSRLAYAAANWGEYAANPLTVLSLWEGGLSLLGAVTVGAAVAWWALGAQRLPRGVGLDAAAVGLALGQAIGRLGCLAAGCATGVELPPGSALPALPLPDSTGLVASRFPSQIVESLADLLLWGLLLWLWARRLRPGAVAVAYLIGYGTLRLLAEPLRENAPALGPFAWVLTWGQAWGALAAAIGVGVLARWVLLRRERPGAEGAPPAPEYAGDV